EITRVQQARTRMSLRVTSLITTEIDRVGALRTRPVMASAAWIIDARTEDITRYVARGAELVDRAVERARTSLAQLHGKLTALSPQGTLDRGYAIARRADGAVVRTASDAPEGTLLTVTVADGSIAAESQGPTQGPTDRPETTQR
ncbi:MAG TPA: exodeoxyribonuclease VII large subunit, partial [Terrimesophilobacter sp.]|nr:exodeoxyribonuclease VII large subunit [Terrimesophilobacter sp.]